MNNQDTISNIIFSLRVVIQTLNYAIDDLQKIKEGEDLDIPEDNKDDYKI